MSALAYLLLTLQLDADSFTARERAQRQLVLAGPVFAQAAVAAGLEASPEMRARCRYILRRWHEDWFTELLPPPTEHPCEDEP